MRIRRDGPLPVVTFATDSAGGFSDEDIAKFARLVDMMGAGDGDAYRANVADDRG